MTIIIFTRIRYEQKRISRDYLILARSELQDVMAVMQDLDDRSRQIQKKT